MGMTTTRTSPTVAAAHRPASAPLRLVYTPRTGREPKFPIDTGTEITYHESAQSHQHLDGIQSGQVCATGYAAKMIDLPARVLCDTPAGVQQIRVADLSVST